MDSTSFSRPTLGRPVNKKEGPVHVGPGLSSVLCWEAGGRTHSGFLTAELPKQLRVPQESHLRKLLSAAHTYSQNWSRITSISNERRPHIVGPVARGLAKPSRVDSRVTVGPV